MCGIFGYVCNDSPSGLLATMGNLLEHRGPDDVGYFSDERTGTHFGLRRLSIIDLEGGHQPLSNEDETVRIVCNGEIFNYIELRKELLAKGHQFNTQGDAEVLVHLYEEKGLDFLDSVNGMFGLALFDEKKRRLILARDRLGIKPLFYSWDGRRLAFASEIKPVLRCPWISREPDPAAISAYLNLLYIPAPKTGFAGIYKLPSGTLAIHENGRCQLRCYWHTDRFLAQAGDPPVSLASAEEELHVLLQDACRLQLRSDVPVGAFLSGGVDSSAVVGMANREGKQGMDTYTIAWKDAREKMDERSYASTVAERYGCRHHEMEISWQDFNELLPRLIWHLEEPNADGAYVPTYLISKFSSRQSKVILTGAGGDELYGGYAFYQPPGGLLPKIRQRIMPGREPYSQRAFNFPWRLVFNEYRNHTADDFLAFYNHTAAESDRLNAEMAFDLNVYLQDNILALTDRMSMAASIEARVPLLDHRIVEFVLGLPSKFKIGQGDTKLIFKNVVAGFLPPEILTRQKDGFGAPIASWLDGPLRPIVKRIIEGGILVREKIVSPNIYSRLDRMIRIRKGWNWALWIVLNLELWYRFVLNEHARPDGISLEDIAKS